MTEKTIAAQIKRITPLTDTILQIILEPEEYVEYQAGQFLDILYGDEALSYSIANAPLGAHNYELHIRHTRDNPYHQGLLADIKAEGQVNIRLPLGNCHLSKLDRTRPILFIAGGTGFAPVKAMIEQLLADSDPRNFELFWGARSQSDLYMDDKVMYWQNHVSHFRYFASLSAKSKSNLAEQVLQQHANDLTDWQMVISGPFEKVYQTRDILISQGVSAAHLFSDAFSYEQK